eukprot:7989681-Heterocapsa_arctica.AAC.1
MPRARLRSAASCVRGCHNDARECVEKVLHMEKVKGEVHGGVAGVVVRGGESGWSERASPV